jgi:Uri superfamily endonuclease
LALAWNRQPVLDLDKFALLTRGWTGDNLLEMELPEAKGTYILIASVAHMRRWEIGRLGKFDLIAGFYAYVGSAFGAGGLRARVGHHLAGTAKPHWHIDYLLQVASPVEVWHSIADGKLEHHWAEFLEGAPRFRVPIPRFGASDYHRGRRSHLFYSPRRPAFRWFRQQMMDTFAGLEIERSTVRSPSALAEAHSLPGPRP